MQNISRMQEKKQEQEWDFVRFSLWQSSINTPGHQRKGFGADGWARDQPDGDVSESSGVMDPHHGVKHCRDGVDVSLLRALVTAPQVQDVPSMQDQEEDMDFTGLH